MDASKDKKALDLTEEDGDSDSDPEELVETVHEAAKTGEPSTVAGAALAAEVAADEKAREEKRAAEKEAKRIARQLAKKHGKRKAAELSEEPSEKKEKKTKTEAKPVRDFELEAMTEAFDKYFGDLVYKPTPPPKVEGGSVSPKYRIPGLFRPPGYYGYEIQAVEYTVRLNHNRNPSLDCRGYCTCQ